MSAPIHPSPDELSGFLDRELPESRRQEVDHHLSDCPECRSLVDGFTFLEELGPRITESLPGDAYWLDLPDRVLARIAAADRAPAPEAPAEPRPSRWRQLWNPQGIWRWAAGSAAAVVILAGAWVTVHQSRSPVAPEPMLAENREDNVALPPAGLTRAVSTGDEESQPAMNPDAFSRRVIMTLGGSGNLGQTLDMPSGQAVVSAGDPGGLGSQVDFSLPPLSPEGRAETAGVLSCGPGVSPLETAFLCAAKADEMGNDDLARQGYQIVRKMAGPSQPIYWESDFRLNYHAWRERLAAAPPGAPRAEVLSELGRLADQSYQEWQASGGQTDCQRAWCLNRTFYKLADEVSPSAQLQTVVDRTHELVRCMNKR